MKKYGILSASSILILIFTLLCLSMSTGTIFAAEVENDDVMHPKFSLLDKDGNVVKGEGVEISTERTCGQCHDTKYINSHNDHYTSKAKINCIVCHFEESRMAGDYTAAHLRVQLPTNENCAGCHGLVQVCEEPLFIPEDFAQNLDYKEGQMYYGITQNTGVILGPQNLSNSFINLKNKKNLHYPWDVHSRRQLDCIACHFIGNDPRYCGNIRLPLGHLLRDPRKIQPPGQTLKRPDHNLKFATCTCCHNPLAVHQNLPYKKRHMDVLSCESCHVPVIYGPAFQTVDRTVVTGDGSARVELRGTDESKDHGNALSTKFFKGYRPFLFPHKDPNKNNGNGYSISPFNLVTYWSWKSGKTGEPVPESILQKVYLSGSGYAVDVLNIFDKNQNQRIDPEELVLDTDKKINLIKEKLKTVGIEDPVIAGTISAHKINHGVINTKHMKRDCSYCHAAESKFGRNVVLAGYAPAGTLPELSADLSPLPLLNGNVTLDEQGKVILERTSFVTGHYIFGHGKIRVLDRIGFLIFILAVLGIMLHGILRYVFSLKHPPPRLNTEKVYMYRFYERLWHWTMASGIIILVVTGLEIHNSGTIRIFGLEYAVRIHNILAAILVINAILSLFYHLTTGEIKQFFGFNRKFVHETLVQTYHYIHGLFKGSAHPIHKTVERKLNPLQQLTYIGLLNILLPFQVITGILIWGADKWPALSDKLGGLTYLAPLHNLGSWLFLSFLAVHIYLTTTGHTVFSNIRAMITGFDDVVKKEHAVDEEHKQLLEMKVIVLIRTLVKKIVKKEKPSIPGGK